jgi:NAD(P)-dependent dehydrogenase (short-subunit alcohol dehydrogenase family)
MIYDFLDKTVLITGGNSGIGKACAVLFAKYGANVLIAARREKESLAVVDEIKSVGGNAAFIKTDMSNPASIENMVNETIRIFGAIDIAINNAGIVGATQTPLAEFPEEDFDSIMSINVKGVFIAMKLELKHMLKNHNGIIINMSSIAGLKAGRASSIYTASKHAVIGLTRATAKEYAPFGIRINALCPALIETPMVVDAKFDEQKSMSDSIPVGRLGKPEEVASAACWLCSDLAAFTIGTALPIDGGIMA